MDELQRVGSMDSLSCDEQNPEQQEEEEECAALQLNNQQSINHLDVSIRAAPASPLSGDRRHSAPASPPTIVGALTSHSGWRGTRSNSAASVVGALRIAGISVQQQRPMMFFADDNSDDALNRVNSKNNMISGSGSGSPAAQGVLPGRRLPFFSERLTGSVQDIVGELDGDHGGRRGRVSPEEVHIDGVAKLKAHIRIPASMDSNEWLKRQSRQSTGGFNPPLSKHASAAGNASPVCLASSQATTASSCTSRLSAVSSPVGVPGGKRGGGIQEGRRSSANIDGGGYDNNNNGRSSRESGTPGTKKLSSRWCGVCENEFTRLLRPHKGRVCRAFVCVPCSPARMLVPGSGSSEHQRACKRCAGDSAPRVVAMASPQKAAPPTLASLRAPVVATTTVGSSLRESSPRAPRARVFSPRVFSPRKPTTAAGPDAVADLKLTSVGSLGRVLAEVTSGAVAAAGTARPVTGADVQVEGLDAVRATEGSSVGDVGDGFMSPRGVDSSDASEGGSVAVTPDAATAEENAANSPAARRGNSDDSPGLSTVALEGGGLPLVSTAPPADYDMAHLPVNVDGKVAGLLSADDADGCVESSAAILRRLPVTATRESSNGTGVAAEGGGRVSDEAVGDVVMAWPVGSGEEDHDDTLLPITATGGDKERKTMVVEVVTTHSAVVPPRPTQQKQQQQEQQQQQQPSSLEEGDTNETPASVVPEAAVARQQQPIASDAEATIVVTELAPDMVDARDDDSDDEGATTEADSVGGSLACEEAGNTRETGERGQGNVLDGAGHNEKEATCGGNVLVREAVVDEAVLPVGSPSEAEDGKTLAGGSSGEYPAVVVESTMTRGPRSATAVSECREARIHLLCSAEKVSAGGGGGSEGADDKGWLFVLKEVIEKGSSCCHKGGTAIM